MKLTYLSLGAALVLVACCTDGNGTADDPAPRLAPARTTSAPSADNSTTRPMAISKSGHDLSPLQTSDAEWRAKLTPEQFEVTRQAGTERAFTGEYWDNHRAGVYVSRCGGLPLFRSEDKFESGTGWPSFTQPIDPEHVIERVDRSLETMGFGVRVEIVDARSGAHLGHVFDDGPPPTGKRYCMNSAALRFVPEGEPMPPESLPVSASAR